MSGSHALSEGDTASPEGRLKPNATGLGGALAISIAVISPTIGVIFISGLVISHAGASAPFAFLVTTLGALALGWTLWQFVVRIPSAGSFYPFITAGLGRSVGFVAGWQLIMAYGILGPANAALFGGFVQPLIQANTGVNIPWQVYGLALVAVVAVMAWLSIHTSMNLTLLFVACELTILTILLVIVLAKGGAAGQVPLAFTPKLATGGLGAIGVSVAYVVLALEGFESCTFLAEEVRRPRRTLPVALMGSIIFCGLFLAFALYAVVVGYGTSHLADAQSAASPLTPLATRYVGHWYVSLIDIAAISAIFGVNVGASNLVYRMIFAMGRDGALLPKPIGRTGPRQTPYVAIILYTIVVAIGVLIGGWVYGPGLSTYGSFGYLAGLTVIPIYMAVAVALPVFMYRKHRNEFNVVKHAVIPLVGFLVYLGPLITSLHPFPSPPLGPLAFVALGWIVVGILAMGWLRRRDPGRLELVGRATFVDSAGEPHVPTPIETAAGQAPAIGEGD
jgi:amino acid transporter